MRFAERFDRRSHAWRVQHASEDATLLAIVAGEPVTPHVSSCALCQARLAELRAWTAGVAADAGALADAVFTPERLAVQKKEILRRLEAAGRSARVIAFPLGAPAATSGHRAQILRWTAAAACAGILVGLASGRLIDTPTPASTVASSAAAPPLAGAASPAGVLPASFDEAALLDAAYDRVAIDALQTMDDITPRAREVARASMPGRRR
jgi:hypothetical protein